MASWPLYSERFILVAAPAGGSYVVPTGSRAIMTCISAQGFGTVGTHGFIAYVNGIAVYQWRLPGVDSATAVNLRIVVYQGGTMGIGFIGNVQSAAISGYLMRETTTKRDVWMRDSPADPKNPGVPLDHP